MVRDKNYNIEVWKPESVTIRSLAYLQKSYDIHNIFIGLFETRVEGVVYKNYKGEDEDKDWTLKKVCAVILRSNDFKDLTKEKKKEYTTEKVVEFFKKNKFYKNSIYYNSSLKSDYIKDWRLKPMEDELDE